MTSIIAHWFKRRRSTALGIMSFASSIGGTVFPVAFRNLNSAVGYAKVTNFWRSNRLISAQIQMVDENHLFCLDAYSWNHEFGKQYRRFVYVCR
jgi:MFS family permease